MRAFDDEYRDFVDRQEEALIWHDSRFIEAVLPADGRHQAVYFRYPLQGEIRAVLPAILKRRLDGPVITMPPLMRYCGPLFAVDLSLEQRAEAADFLLREALKHCISFDQSWPPATSALFQASWPVKRRLRPTYFLATRPDLAAQIELANKSTRRKMRRASEIWELEQLTRVSESEIEVLAQPFKNQKLKPPYDPNILIAATNSLSACGLASILRCKHAEGWTGAVSVMLKDRHFGYTWVMGGIIQQGLKAPGHYLDLNAAILAHKSQLPLLDFLGSELPGVAEGHRILGAEKQTYAHFYADKRPWTSILRAWRMRGLGKGQESED